VHGGAGTQARAADAAAYSAAVTEALQRGGAALCESARAAVVAAVAYMEEATPLNAGRGAVLDADGTERAHHRIPYGARLRVKDGEKIKRGQRIAEICRLPVAAFVVTKGQAVPEDLAREVTQSLSIPTIGIGAGVHCDGQVLVMHDMLGLCDWAPSFVKQYANLGALATQAARNFAEEVANSKFPDARHSYR